jgi:MEMO1 family protein
MFYPVNASSLKQEISNLLARVKTPAVEGTVRGLISPHAGYAYSGLTAAYGFASLCHATYETVVIVSPSHREYFNGVSVFPGVAYQTPLGVVKIDTALREQLDKVCPVVKISSEGHREEHAVEVQLPFLQSVLGDFKFLPVVIGDQRRENCYELGEALGTVLKDVNYLLVASTDLSHFYPEEVANTLDEIVIHDIEQFDYDRLMADIDAGRAEACGGGPAVAVMLALRRLGVTKMHVLHHSNSGDVTGDRHSVVGYLSALAYS